MMITFVLISTLVFGLLALAWVKDNGLDMILKVFFALLTIWGVGLIINNPQLFLVG